MTRILSDLMQDPYLAQFKLRKSDCFLTLKEGDLRKSIELQHWADMSSLSIKPVYGVKFGILTKWFEKFSFKTLRDQRDNSNLIFGKIEGITRGWMNTYDFVIEWCLQKLKQDSKHNYLQMKLNNLFKRFKGTGLNDQDVPVNDHDDFEIIISSDDPYRTRTSVNDGLEETATFAESWEVRTEAMEKSTRVPVRVLYDEKNLYRLDLYLPDATTNREMRERGQNLTANLWLFFDDDEFIIIFPELIDLYMDNEQTITHYRLNLGKTGFHSELKRLGDKYSHKEICDMVCKKLSESDIVEIEPKIIEDETYDCHPVTVSTHTARTLKKAFKAIRNAL